MIGLIVNNWPENEQKYLLHAITFKLISWIKPGLNGIV